MRWRKKKKKSMRWRKKNKTSMRWKEKKCISMTIISMYEMEEQ